MTKTLIEIVNSMKRYAIGVAFGLTMVSGLGAGCPNSPKVEDKPSGITQGILIIEAPHPGNLIMQKVRYIGPVLNGKPTDGEAEMYYDDGSHFRGSTKEGKREGVGTYFDGIGNSWNGLYHENLEDGEFFNTTTDGKKYVQFYVKGKRDTSAEDYLVWKFRQKLAKEKIEKEQEEKNQDLGH